ncbi:hypothetical protein SLA_2388 [Streptomyces laurentii]|uniref:Uncharacterized protein n=1 Tax=Streptomyces laurentii TaxID=39478 RepID=A0A160NYT1_STRLU|nr:hypothetical protein SLA_2388 [Streptomyces laurentii]
MSTTVRVNLTRRCCQGGTTKGDTRQARWEIYVVLLGNPDEWPAFQWPVSRRNTIPTPDERARALASLGYRPAPGAQWEWDEITTPDYHGHPSTVAMLAGTVAVPLSDGE